MKTEEFLRIRAAAALSTSAEKRRHRRQPLLGYVYLSYLDDEGNWADYVPGLTVNKSASGLCIFIDRPIQVGAEVRVQLHPCTRDDSHPKMERLARVQWCRKAGQELYKIGLNVNGPGA